MPRSSKTTAAAALAVSGLVFAAGCGSSNPSTASSTSTAGSGKSVNAATATSAAAFGGMNGLVTACKKEGALNVITLPANWANYGTIMKDFTAKYGVKINDANPDGSSQDEINAMQQLRGQSRAPDVLDVGTAFAIKADQLGLLAPYKVATWSAIPANSKASDATWFDDYGGYVAIGYDSAKVKVPPTSFKDLLKPAYKNQVAINGNPTQPVPPSPPSMRRPWRMGARWGISSRASSTSSSCTRSATSCRSPPARRPCRAARPRSWSGGITCSLPRSRVWSPPSRS